jgi:hypothetical protein
MTRQPYTPPR